MRQCAPWDDQLVDLGVGQAARTKDWIALAGSRFSTREAKSRSERIRDTPSFRPKRAYRPIGDDGSTNLFNLAIRKSSWHATPIIGAFCAVYSSISRYSARCFSPS